MPLLSERPQVQDEPPPVSGGVDAARAAYLATPDALPGYSDDAFLGWWSANRGAYNPLDYGTDFNLISALAGQGNPTARQILGQPAEPSFFGTFFGDTPPVPVTVNTDANIPTNLGAVAPVTPYEQFTAPAGDSSGDILAQLTGFVRDLFAVNRPGDVTTISTPTTNTTNVTVNNSGVSEGGLLAMFDTFFNRLPGLLSVPAGGNGVISPSNPAVGYAPNPAQSTQRTGFQTVATVMGLPGSQAPGQPWSPWRLVIVGAVFSVIAFALYRKFFSR